MGMRKLAVVLLAAALAKTAVPFYAADMDNADAAVSVETDMDMGEEVIVDEESEEPAKEEETEQPDVVQEIRPEENTAARPDDTKAEDVLIPQPENTESPDAAQQESPKENEAPQPTDPKSLIPADSDKEKKQYKTLINSVFLDHDNCSVKKIVTELKKNGTFIAEDLGSWLKAQDVYDISVVEDNGDLKKLYYKSNEEKQYRDEFWGDEDRICLQFYYLVNEDDVITCTDTCFEVVTSVEEDGSFYTNYVISPACETE